MPAPLAVDKEAVRVLVVAVGVAEAARATGIGLSTIKQWSARGKWLAHTRAEPVNLPKSMQPVSLTGVTSPAKALQDVMAEGKQRYNHAMAKTISRKAESYEALEPEQVKPSELDKLSSAAARIFGSADGDKSTGTTAIQINIG